MKNLLTLISIILYFSCNNSTQPDTTPPSVTITFPLNESTLTEITTIKVNASDNEGVETVTFIIDGDIVFEDTQSPYEFEWDVCALDSSSHSLLVEAEDKSENVGTSDLLTFTTNGIYDCDNVCGGENFSEQYYNCDGICISDTDSDGICDELEVYIGIDINKPSAYISSPNNGDLISDTLIVTAIASDDIGINYLELWINQENTNIKDYEPPYEFIINTFLTDFEEGSIIQLSVKAFDTSENESALSTPVEVILDNQNPTPVILNPIINEGGILQFNWSQCNDLDFYAYVVMINNIHFSFIDTIFTANDIQRNISYNSTSIDFFKIKVMDIGMKESESNSVQPVSFDFITVDPGVFNFGPNNNSETVDAQFQLMSTEVTNLQYRSYLSVAKELNQIDTTNIGPWVLDNEGNILYDLENGYVKWDGSVFYIEGIINNHHIPYYPVICVSWIGATHFAEFFNFRLPTEIEWEKAAGNEGLFDYPWGNEYDENDNPINEINSSHANYQNNEDLNDQIEPYEPGNGINQINEPGLAPVSQYQEDVNPFWFFNTCPNECYGFNHMAGNVWEWVNHDNGYPSSQMCRGGSWRSVKQDLRVWSTKLLESHVTGDHIGFRCAKLLFRLKKNNN